MAACVMVQPSNRLMTELLSETDHRESSFLSDWMTSTELRRRWLCTRQTIWRYERAGVIPKGRMILGAIRHKRSDIAEAELRMVAGRSDG